MKEGDPMAQQVILEPYQEICKRFILQHSKCGIFLDVGYGKTLTTLAAIQDLKPRNVLIVAPKAIARTTWHTEVKKFGYAFNCYSMVEKKNPKTGLLKEIPLKNLIPLYEAIPHTHPGTVNLFITSVEARLKHLIDWCEENNIWPFQMIVCDEFQKFKSGTSIRTKSMKTLVSHTPRLVGLTGSPMPNSIEDIWSQIYLLDNGQRLGRYISHFRSKYEYPTMVVNGHTVGWKPLPGAKEDIYSKISDIAVSVKADLHLPPVRFNDIKITLNKDEMELYEQFKKRWVLDLEKLDPFIAYSQQDTKILPKNAAVMASKLLQFASGSIYDEKHNAHFIHNQKLVMTQYIIDNTDSPILLAYTFACDQKRLLDELTCDHGPIVMFDGSEKMKDAWNNKEYAVMLFQPAATCHGINLQDGGHTLIWYSLPWNLEHYIQTNGRLWRKGQQSPVMIHRLIAKKTFDERVAAALAQKQLGNAELLDAVRREVTSP